MKLFYRLLGGWNDNPNVSQFNAAYRKLLGNSLIRTSRKGNCESTDVDSNPFSNILYVSTKRDKYSTPTDEEIEHVVLNEFETLHQKLSDLNETEESNLTDNLRGYMIAHIANVIEEKIRANDNCDECINVFKICAKVERAFDKPKSDQKPCQSTYAICKETDGFLKLCLLNGNINFNTIYYTILNNIDADQLFKEADFSRHPEHRLYLIRAIIDAYIQIKGTFMARTATLDMHTTQFRWKFNKLIHFYGQ